MAASTRFPLLRISFSPCRFSTFSDFGCGKGQGRQDNLLVGAQKSVRIPCAVRFGVCQNSDSIALEIPFISNFQPPSSSPLRVFAPDRLNDDDWQATREFEFEWNSAPLPLFKRPPSMTHIMVGHRGARGRGQEGEDPPRRARGTCTDRGGRD